MLEDLKARAREAGLWNLFLPDSERGGGFSNLQYAPLCEQMGRVGFASEVFNCSAPDTGNMETIERYGSEEQKKQWLDPLLEGRMRSAFAMTEPAVASSDATNIETDIRRDGDEYVINGRKWWASGICDPRCEILIVMGKTDPDGPAHAQQSMILVPRSAPGVKVERFLPVFGYDDAPHGHGEVSFANVRVPANSASRSMMGLRTSVAKLLSAPCTTIAMRSKPIPVSMFFCGSGSSTPPSRRSNCVNTRFQISAKRGESGSVCQSG